MPASTARCSTSAVSPPTTSCRRASEEWLLEAYFERAADRRSAPALRRDEMRLAAARGDVEHGVGDPLDARVRLRRLHQREPRPLRARVRRRSDRTPDAAIGSAPHDVRSPRQARAVVIGGGIIGCCTPIISARARLDATSCCSSAHKLTSGSTWHAAGLVGQLRTSANITQLLKIQRRALRPARGGDRPGDRLEDATAACASPATPSG